MCVCVCGLGDEKEVKVPIAEVDGPSTSSVVELELVVEGLSLVVPMVTPVVVPLVVMKTEVVAMEAVVG